MQPSAKKTNMTPQPQCRQEYKQDQKLQKVADFIVCKTESMIDRAVYDIKDYMDQVCRFFTCHDTLVIPMFAQQKLNAFNDNVAAVTEVLSMRCKAHNWYANKTSLCAYIRHFKTPYSLNFTNIEPSKRNDVSKMNCLVPNPTDNCQEPFVWRPRDPMRCKPSSDPSAHGVCGADKKCYTSDNTFPKIINEYKQLRDKFFQDPTIAQFRAFDKYVWFSIRCIPLHLMNHVTACTTRVRWRRMSRALWSTCRCLRSSTCWGLETSPTKTSSTLLVWLRLAPSLPNIIPTVPPPASAAKWVQNRIDFHTNVNVTLKTVLESSTKNFPPERDFLEIRWSCSEVFENNTWWGCNGMWVNTRLFT